MRPCVALSILALTAGCGDECHDIGCGSSLIIELSMESGAWPDDRFEVAVDAGADSTACAFAISGNEGVDLGCSGDVATVDTSELAQGYVLVRMYAAEPEQVVVTVSNHGNELASAELTPEYEDVVVDPEACGGPCRAAQVSLVVPGQ